MQVENGIANGTPDTYASVMLGSAHWRGWLELKYGENVPAKASTGVFKSVNRGLSVEQEATLFKMWQHGVGSAYVLARVVKSVYLVPGRLAFEFNAMTVDDLAFWEIDLSELRMRLVSSAHT